jgi:hypothetical protein
MSMNKTCEVCGRAEGAAVDLCGDEGGAPLAPLERCDLCGHLVCPDCNHESDCCFMEADDHADDPDWAPPGWKVDVEKDDHPCWRRVEE